LFTQKAEGYSNERSRVLQSLSDQRESLEGVSLDEEAANMVKAQKAFQAATRMVNTIDEMLDRIINNMGLVGR
jgi:flagellar hook-associated protein 1